ncbi:MAG: DUF4386 domain-containing protein [Balneolaceae bacterium]|nr:DUF4386 domain-containing protein [Balneolaceae bacterium]MBO6547668.1 DUF4386 domain-containing protein [Balneolaceae bacterium]MBO6648179.1 DUF4386 domain-containing protein [Balneolaceae bacterium]
MTDYDIQKKYGRIAGILYLIIIVSGVFSEGIVRSSLVIDGNAKATVENITNAELLFRMGFVSDIIMVLADISIALVFYLMLKQVNKPISLLAATFRLAQAIIIGVNLMNHFGVILVINSTDLATAFNSEQLSSTVMIMMEAHSYGYLLSGVFFGFSCMVLSYLIRRSEYLPSFFGVLIGVAGFFYIMDSFTQFIAPEYSEITEFLVIISAVVSEISFAVWLTVKGAVSPETKKATDY